MEMSIFCHTTHANASSDDKDIKKPGKKYSIQATSKQILVLGSTNRALIV